MNETMTQEEIQVILTGTFGDGSIQFNKSMTAAKFTASSIHESYLEFKKSFLNLEGMYIKGRSSKTCKAGVVYELYCYLSPDVAKIHSKTLKEKLDLLNDFGIALWFYDDGCKHKSKNAYDLATHAFTKEEHEEIIIPFFNSINLFPSLYSDKRANKYYLHFPAFKGGLEIGKKLSKYKVDVFDYKQCSEEILAKWEIYKHKKIDMNKRCQYNDLNAITL